MRFTVEVAAEGAEEELAAALAWLRSPERHLSSAGMVLSIGPPDNQGLFKFRLLDITLRYRLKYAWQALTRYGHISTGVGIEIDGVKAREIAAELLAYADADDKHAALLAAASREKEEKKETSGG